MAVTSGGTPYVESSDLVANYPAASLALANKVDTKVDKPGGSVGVSITGTGLTPATSPFSAGTISADLNWGMYYRANTSSVLASHAFVNAGGTLLMNIGSTGLITGSGSLGAWVVTTPTVGGTGWAIGNGTITTISQTLGKIVHFHTSIVWGSTSTFGSVALTVSLPHTASAGFNRPEIHFIGGCGDVSTGLIYSLNPCIGNTTTLTIYTAAEPHAAVTAMAPFTWAIDDRIEISGTYERV
jgi:hypothetical protein